MARRHERRLFFLADKREMRGAVNRPATRSEMERSFRFSEIVRGSMPAPSDALLKALATVMTASRVLLQPSGHTVGSPFGRAPPAQAE